MRILICTGIYPPEIGGPATYSKILNDELPMHGIGVKVLSFGGVRGLPKILRHFVYFLKIISLAKGIDIIFAQDPVSVGLPSVITAKILRKKFVIKIVGDYAWEQQQCKMKNAKCKTIEEFQTEKYDFITELRKKIERWVAKKADKIIVPSQYLKKIILMWGARPEKINIIYNSFEMPKLPNKLELSGFNIISVGRLVPWKGFNTLIEIMPDIIKEIASAKLHIIGSGPEEKNLKFKIKNLKLENQVILTSQLPHEDVMEYLRGGDIFVLNTGYEGFSHLLLEAMAMGIPVVTTNVGGNPEIIVNNESGILIEYDNKEQLKKAIVTLYKNQELRNKITQNTKEKIKEFSKEKMIKETIKILCES